MFVNYTAFQKNCNIYHALHIRKIVEAFRPILLAAISRYDKPASRIATILPVSKAPICSNLTFLHIGGILLHKVIQLTDTHKNKM